MKTIKDKYLVVGADFAGYPLKEAVCAHLREKGWKITDLGVTADSDPDNDTDLMFHRVGLRVGAMISEGEFDRALLFCGTGMGIHIAASKCPHVHAGVVDVQVVLVSAANSTGHAVCDCVDKRLRGCAVVEREHRLDASLADDVTAGVDAVVRDVAVSVAVEHSAVS